MCLDSNKSVEVQKDPIKTETIMSQVDAPPADEYDELLKTVVKKIPTYGRNTLIELDGGPEDSPTQARYRGRVVAVARKIWIEWVEGPDGYPWCCCAVYPVNIGATRTFG